mmetsp:Transcript_43122/g.104357  ORF Transcript_43122/g.104357 Transcript_43122/m.104357 type:complete len:216 (-) Transcript_43122:630-1277(-)
MKVRHQYRKVQKTKFPQRANNLNVVLRATRKIAKALKAAKAPRGAGREEVTPVRRPTVRAAMATTMTTSVKGMETTYPERVETQTTITTEKVETTDRVNVIPNSQRTRPLPRTSSARRMMQLSSSTVKKIDPIVAVGFLWTILSNVPRSRKNLVQSLWKNSHPLWLLNSSATGLQCRTKNVPPSKKTSSKPTMDCKTIDAIHRSSVPRRLPTSSL